MLHTALKYLRRYHGLKQQEMAARLGISKSYLSEIESGLKAHAITIDVLNRYAEVFSMPVSSILLFSEQVEPNRRSERVRLAMAKKIANILAWIDEDEHSES